MTTTGQFVIAREGTFSWAAGSGDTQVVSVVGLRDVAWAEWREEFKTTPVQYRMMRRTMGILDARVVIGSMYDKSGATPTTPGLTGNPPTNPGVITATFANGDTKSCTGFITRLDWSFAGGGVGAEQEYHYVFVASAEDSTSTITTT